MKDTEQLMELSAGRTMDICDGVDECRVYNHLPEEECKEVKSRHQK